MLGLNARACALLVSVSVVAMGIAATPVIAQTVDPSAQAVKPKPIKKKRAGKPMAEVPLPQNVANANAQVGKPVYQSLDEITVGATKLEERAIDALAGVSKINQEEINRVGPARVSDIFTAIPSVSFQERGDEPGTAIAIRGLQDFGRVAVVIDGARQNFQRTGHNANGYFYLDPAMIGDVDVVRGPVANIYGSGAIGGVVSFRTKDVEDVLRVGERWGVLSEMGVGSNDWRANVSTFAAGRSQNGNVDVIVGGSYRAQSDYKNGNGVTVPNTASDIQSGLAKLTFRPADGHEVKVGFLGYDARYNTGQPSIPNTSGYATDTSNQTATLSWKYQKPEDRLFDYKASVYFNSTETDQTKNAGPASPITGAIGDKRSFTVDTIGFDIHNTSRVDTGPVAHAITYGGDYFSDKVTVKDPTGASGYTTPNGDRRVDGAFVQVKSNYSMFEFINAVRFDEYELKSGNFSTGGNRFSPKSTIGITPAPWVTAYATYAEGYRAPAVTETLVSGFHPGVGVSDGSTNYLSLFTLLPNLALRPEVGKTKEAGLNLRFNDVLKPGDRIRAKINVFRNDVDDYIDLVSFGPSQPLIQICPGPPGFCPVPIPWLTVASTTTSLVQYQNIANARIDGVELESTYDSGAWFAGLAGSWMKGINVSTGERLQSVPGQKIATTLGARFFDQRLTASVRWVSVAAQSGLSTLYNPATNYDLVNLYLAYQPTPDIVASVGIDNLLDRYYIPFATLRSSDGTDTALAGSAPGRVYKASLRVRFGGV
jgi:hemoglobin/transferrin/lactoferrin receptor protein